MKYTVMSVNSLDIPMSKADVFEILIIPNQGAISTSYESHLLLMTYGSQASFKSINTNLKENEDHKLNSVLF